MFGDRVSVEKSLGMGVVTNTSFTRLGTTSVSLLTVDNSDQSIECGTSCNGFRNKSLNSNHGGMSVGVVHITR